MKKGRKQEIRKVSKKGKGRKEENKIPNKYLICASKLFLNQGNYVLKIYVVDRQTKKSLKEELRSLKNA